jgi:predicted HD phosphohydrolase
VLRSRALFAFLLSELSDASKNTLLQQGGVMSDFEADKFEKSEQFDVILKTRKWDEQGKYSEVETPPLQKYKRLCLEYLKGTQEVAKS